MSADITITGAGSAATIVDGNQLVGVFDIIGTDEIDGITVRNGLDASGVGGGGIHNGGTFTGTDLALDGNTTNGPGGGLFNEGTAYLIQGTLRNNMAAEGGGFSNTGFISVLGSFTIDGNTSTAEGGGVRNDGFVSLDNTNPPVPPAPPTGGGTISANHSGTSGAPDRQEASRARTTRRHSRRRTNRRRRPGSRARRRARRGRPGRSPRRDDTESCAHATSAISCTIYDVGVTPETLRKWLRRDQVDSGPRSGVTTSERERIRQLEREVRELRRANEILKPASIFFAGELDP